VLSAHTPTWPLKWAAASATCHLFCCRSPLQLVCVNVRAHVQGRKGSAPQHAVCCVLVLLEPLRDNICLSASAPLTQQCLQATTRGGGYILQHPSNSHISRNPCLQQQPCVPLHHAHATPPPLQLCCPLQARQAIHDSWSPGQRPRLPLPQQQDAGGSSSSTTTAWLLMRIGHR
jgi:hypothetical protein